MLRCSIIISSYNYAPYLRQAIDSALAQQRAGGETVEVIVVDDGSTDGSREIIRGYGPRVRSILKRNEGQASAFNAGFEQSRGEIIVFLDSDDVLLPTAVARAADAFEDAGVVKVHWPMTVIDVAGVPTGRVVPSGELADGDLRDLVLRDGPDAYGWPPTSGNAWRRGFLEQVLPVPAAAYRVCPDLYLANLVPVFGKIRRLEEPQSQWRVHGQNNTWADRFEVRLPRLVERWDIGCEALERYCRSRGIDVDVPRWRHNAWCHRVLRAAARIRRFVPCGETFILIDADDWGADRHFFGRHCRRFVEREGEYWGPPADDASAIAELRRQRDCGAAYLAIAWPCFWWRDQYPGFLRHLEQTSLKVDDNEDLLLFDLHAAT